MNASNLSERVVIFESRMITDAFKVSSLPLRVAFMPAVSVYKEVIFDVAFASTAVIQVTLPCNSIIDSFMLSTLPVNAVTSA